ncbi:MAG: CPBP family intramembrane glutamic endopeptidase [Acidimicrobiales bacterium]
MEPPLRQPTPRWGLGDAALGMVVGLMLSAGAASAWLGASGGEELSLGGRAISQIGLWTGLVGAAVWASRRKGSGRLAEDFGLRMRGVDVVIGLVLGVACQLGLVNLIAFLLSPLIGHPDVAGPVTDLVRDTKGPKLVGVVLFTVVGAPVVEELFFRGLLLRSLQRRLPNVVAIPVSALLFGASHLQPLSPEGLLLVVTSLVAFGAVLAYITVRTGRLGPAIWTHAVFNAYTMVALLTE